jgi:hypothetical protein
MPGTLCAGDRFRETYYWDSYWVLRGLLVSGMTKTAAFKTVLRHLLAKTYLSATKLNLTADVPETLYVQVTDSVRRTTGTPIGCCAVCLSAA